MGVYPRIGAANNSCLALLTSIANIIMALTNNLLPTNYMCLYLGLALAGGMMAKGVYIIIKKYKLNSLVIFFALGVYVMLIIS